jgi:hypothetical protein
MISLASSSFMPTTPTPPSRRFLYTLFPHPHPSQRSGCCLLHLLCASTSSSLLAEELQERFRLLDLLLADCDMNPIPGEPPSGSPLPSSLKTLSSISPLFSCYSHRSYLMAHHLIHSYHANLNCVNQVPLPPLLPPPPHHLSDSPRTGTLC